MYAEEYGRFSEIKVKQIMAGSSGAVHNERRRLFLMILI